jgi:UDP-3-O-[3-hydroxymyristoyl] glucosamine N-acyltransferase
MLLSRSSYPLKIISDHVHGKVLGDPELVIQGLCTLDAPQPNHITFIRAKGILALSRALKSLGNCAAFVLDQEIPNDVELGTTSLVLVPEPYTAFLDSVELFYHEEPHVAGVDSTATIHPSATIHPTAAIGPYCVVGRGVTIDAHTVLGPNVRVFEDAHIGESTVLNSGVVVRERCIIGKHCIIHDNTVIGADGFGYTPDKTLGLRKVPQLGNVNIADRVEIGANSCIDRGALGSTTVGFGTKIDNLVQIGHNTTIGKFCIICGQVGIAGSTVIEDGVVLSGQVGVSDHRRIVSGVRVGGGAPVTEDILEPGDYFGHPLLRVREWHRHQVELRARMSRRNAPR